MLVDILVIDIIAESQHLVIIQAGFFQLAAPMHALHHPTRVKVHFQGRHVRDHHVDSCPNFAEYLDACAFASLRSKVCRQTNLVRALRLCARWACSHSGWK